MNRQHAPFILYPRDKNKRKALKHKVFYYCQYRLADGTLSNPFSTGCTNKTEAYLFVQKLINEGKICCGSDYLFYNYMSDILQ